MTSSTPPSTHTQPGHVPHADDHEHCYVCRLERLQARLNGPPHELDYQLLHTGGGCFVLELRRTTSTDDDVPYLYITESESTAFAPGTRWMLGFYLHWEDEGHHVDDLSFDQLVALTQHWLANTPEPPHPALRGAISEHTAVVNPWLDESARHPVDPGEYYELDHEYLGAIYAAVLGLARDAYEDEAIIETIEGAVRRVSRAKTERWRDGDEDRRDQVSCYSYARR